MNRFGSIAIPNKPCRGKIFEPNFIANAHLSFKLLSTDERTDIARTSENQNIYVEVLEEYVTHGTTNPIYSLSFNGG